jgi:acetylornithine deacetylase/succinyl-diaminopimelate desuccinylase-like protein
MTKSAVDSPTWRLVQALATFTDRTGNDSQLDGFRDRVRPPSARESALLQSLAGLIDEVGLRSEYDVDRWVDGVRGSEMLKRLLLEPSINISGIGAGRLGEAALNIIPHEASARLDIRRVPDQRAGEILPLVRAHLDRRGFSDIQVTQRSAVDPWQTDPDVALARTAVDT